VEGWLGGGDSLWVAGGRDAIERCKDDNEDGGRERGETVGRRQLGRLGSDSSFAEPRRLLTGQDWGDPWLVVEEGM
jgi:hypothetical protein